MQKKWEQHVIGPVCPMYLFQIIVALSSDLFKWRSELLICIRKVLGS
jgi:hypothetical protein